MIGTSPDDAAVRRVLDELGARQTDSARPRRLPDGRTIASHWFAHGAAGAAEPVS